MYEENREYRNEWTDMFAFLHLAYDFHCAWFVTIDCPTTRSPTCRDFVGKHAPFREKNFGKARNKAVEESKPNSIYPGQTGG